MIYIDFQGGSHGHYLEFVCNKHLAGVGTDRDTPFDSLGASHKKLYTEPQQFSAGHYFQNKKTQAILDNCKIISVRIDSDDLLLLSAVSLLRAGNKNLDNNKLEYNTFFKLNNPQYISLLHNLQSSFFDKNVEESYNAIRDPSWPEVKSIDDFKKLPDRIKVECIEVHNLELLELNKDQPHCPRHVLREFFKIGFKNPKQSGFMVEQEKMVYSEQCDVYNFSFKSFYNSNQFLKSLDEISQWAACGTYNKENVLQLHEQFLQKQIYKDSKLRCDRYVEQYRLGEQLGKMNLLEESYCASILNLSQQQCRVMFDEC